jgi:hypothetical protein
VAVFTPPTFQKNIFPHLLHNQHFFTTSIINLKKKVMADEVYDGAIGIDLGEYTAAQRIGPQQTDHT